ncbi:hypothetical protein F2Q70_00003674 [Brassica cretica]|uniref:Uncharacterized protein n=1 Tax=Brassica cretica TaxID=69181 RepID=A0A8S9IPC8_BRACR|nr:hypothetical protein F2Q70_00003674 [Brassica cretica]KAF3567882.1 hypothetical protein DY000_02015560 [Brassica cretica]
MYLPSLTVGEFPCVKRTANLSLLLADFNQLLKHRRRPLRFWETRYVNRDGKLTVIDRGYPRDFIEVGRVVVQLKREDETLLNPAITSSNITSRSFTCGESWYRDILESEEAGISESEGSETSCHKFNRWNFFKVRLRWQEEVISKSSLSLLLIFLDIASASTAGDLFASARRHPRGSFAAGSTRSATVLAFQVVFSANNLTNCPF